MTVIDPQAEEIVSQREFFARHVACGPNHVVVLTLIYPDGGATADVFSDLDKAVAHANGEGKDAQAAVFVPKVIDMPEFGNAPKDKQQ